MAWHSVLARRILPRPTPTPAGDKPPRYISPFPPMDPCPVSGYWSASAGLSRQKPGRPAGLPFATHPGRFANRPYNDVCLWWDAWLGGLLGREQDDRADCERARPDVDEAGVLNQPG